MPPPAPRSFDAEIVTGYLSDLGGLLGKDVARAHTMLEFLIGQITLKPGEKGLYTTFRGNVEGFYVLKVFETRS